VANSLGGILGSLIAVQTHDLMASYTASGGIDLNVFSDFPVRK